MQAVILIGGMGTRLRELYPDLPKALVPILGQPFLHWQLKWLAQGGINHVHLAAGYKAEAVAEWIGSGFTAPSDQFRVALSTEPQPLGTAGALKFVESRIRRDPFLVLNGDSLIPDLNFQALEEKHEQVSKAWATIAVAQIEESGRYGTVDFDDKGWVTAFREKAERAAGWINGGVYLMTRQALSLIQPDQPCSIETDLFPGMAAERRLIVYRTRSRMLDMGTPEGIKAMEGFLAAHHLSRG